MSKNQLLFICFWLSVCSWPAQSSKRNKHPGQSVDVIYGQKFLSGPNLNKAFNSLDELKPGGPLAYVGIGTIVPSVVNRDLNYYSNFSYTQVIPQQIHINDSTTAKITGFNLGLTMLSYDAFKRKKHISLIIGLGANTGRLRLYGRSETKLKNPYFSPKVNLLPRLIFGKLILQGLVEYELDLSGPNWRKTNIDKTRRLNLPKTKASGLGLSLSLGYVLNN